MHSEKEKKLIAKVKHAILKRHMFTATTRYNWAWSNPYSLYDKPTAPDSKLNE